MGLNWICLRTILLVLLGLTSVGCMVGPDFHPPCPPHTKSYTKPSLPNKTVSIKSGGRAGVSQRMLYSREIPAEWWTLFHSSAINQLVEKGIANSPTMASAQAKLRQAQENLNAQFGTLLFPTVAAQLSGQRQRFSDATIGGGDNTALFNLFNASVNVSYTLDVFGGSRRQIEALRAQVDYQRYQMVGTYLTLTSNIVTTALTVASFQEQITATKQLIHAQEDQLHIIEKQLHLGGASHENVLSQQTLVAQTRAQLPPLEKSLAQSRHALAVLIGCLPSETDLPQVTLSQLTLPSRLPVSLPSSLLRQRPDVQAQEALLHQASAQIGVATANLLPQFTISGTEGWSAVVPNQLFTATTNTWAYGAQIAQTVFQGGALLAKRRAAMAGFDAAVADYKQTVLKAMSNVADVLHALQDDARAFKAQKQAENAARETLFLTRKQYRLGAVSYLSLLTAEQQYQQTVIGRIQAQTLRYNDTVALFQALGGGWWNRACV